MHAAHERVTRIYVRVRDEIISVCEKIEQTARFIVK